MTDRSMLPVTAAPVEGGAGKACRDAASVPASSGAVAASAPDRVEDADQDAFRAAVRRLVTRMRADALWLRRDPTDRDSAILVRAGAKASLGAGRVRWSLVEAALADGLLLDHGRGRIGVAMPGSETLRDGHASNGPDMPSRSESPEGEAAASAAESPLVWLHRRRGADGQPLIDAAAFAAGERLRRDVTLAALLPSVTQNWSRADGSGSSGGFDPAGASDATIAARQRVRAMYRVLGARTGDFLIDVCGFLMPLQEAERRRGWPARSGKLVLGLALGQLAAHYGLSNEARGPAGDAGAGEAAARRRHVWHSEAGPTSVQEMVARRRSGEACVRLTDGAALPGGR